MMLVFVALILAWCVAVDFLVVGWAIGSLALALALLSIVCFWASQKL